MAKLSLAETFQTIEQVRTGNPCKTCTIIAGLNAEDKESLLAWMNNSEITTTTIIRVLAAYGIRVSASSVSRHRRGHV